LKPSGHRVASRLAGVLKPSQLRIVRIRSELAKIGARALGRPVEFEGWRGQD
jgi:hypothetical protein